MKKTLIFALLIFITHLCYSQKYQQKADSLNEIGLLIPALDNYKMEMAKSPSRETAYRIATTAALLWMPEMRDTAFYYLTFAIRNDQNLAALHDPSLVSLHSDPRWKEIEDLQIRKYERNHQEIRNPEFAKEQFRIMMKEEAFSYAKKVARMNQAAVNARPVEHAFYPGIALQEQKFKEENIAELRSLLVKYRWPTAADVTQMAADATIEIVLKAPIQSMVKFFPYVSQAFYNDKMSAIAYATAKDRIRIHKGKSQYYGTQVENTYELKYPIGIKNPEKVNRRRARIGLGPLEPYLADRLNDSTQYAQK